MSCGQRGEEIVQGRLVEQRDGCVSFAVEQRIGQGLLAGLQVERVGRGFPAALEP